MRNIDPGIVDENIQPAGLRDYLLNEARSACRVGEVCAEHQVLVSIEACGHLLRKIPIPAIVNGDTRTLPGQLGGDCGANTSRRASDQANFTAEATVHFKATSFSGSMRTTM